MKRKDSSDDVKGSLWNHLDKKLVLLWHREAPLFLRVDVLLQSTQIWSLLRK